MKNFGINTFVGIGAGYDTIDFSTPVIMHQKDLATSTDIAFIIVTIALVNA
jgi:hypothetical protein